MTQIKLTESKKEELAQKYIDYICKRHGLDQESREALLIYYAYMHGMNNCLDELNRKENKVITQYIDKDSLIKEIDKRVFEDYNTGNENDEIAQGVLASFKYFIERYKVKTLDEEINKLINEV